MKLTSFGGAGTVTGSKHLLSHNGKHILVDCGLFQGLKNLRELNWEPLPIAPKELDAVVLTHAHADHAHGLAGIETATSIAHESTRDRLALDPGAVAVAVGGLADGGAAGRVAGHRRGAGTLRHHPL